RRRLDPLCTGLARPGSVGSRNPCRCCLYLEHERGDQGHMFKTIVWANDGSEAAENALPLVQELAKEGGATGTIVHVVERVEGIGAVGLPHRADEEEVQAHLRKLAEQLNGEGIKASLEVKGDVGTRPAHAVADMARTTNADL